ncbi:helix-turn-helix domain-containing protein [Duganella sacchari]|uniref:helix-turn-helix domain-containing protein n=1 Tax=Duganella sacchari TaxID=551987 RepID=UPI0009350E62|nr:helix-turn-helix transcriptional regulator [Duganella sacchari]
MSPTSPNSPLNTFTARAVMARNIVKFREQRGWSQEMLAFEAGLHRTFIAHVERQARNISIDNVEKIAIAFKVETYKLLIPN